MQTLHKCSSAKILLLISLDSLTTYLALKSTTSCKAPEPQSPRKHFRLKFASVQNLLKEKFEILISLSKKEITICIILYCNITDLQAMIYQFRK